MRASVLRALQIGRAFLRMSVLAAISYPMTLVFQASVSIFPLILAYFLNRIVSPSSHTIGGDYFVFFVLGQVSFLVVNRGLDGLGTELDQTIQQGRLELLMIEPVRWRDIPLGLGLWPNLFNLVLAGITIGLSLALGATYRLAGLVPALLIIGLGMAAALSIGLLATSLRVLAKKSDPLGITYNLAAGLLSGLWVPLNVLPAWLRPFAWLLPTTYVTSGLRKSLMAHASHIYGPTPVQAIILLVLLNAILFPIGWRLLERSLGYGRKMGLLAGY